MKSPLVEGGETTLEHEGERVGIKGKRGDRKLHRSEVRPGEMQGEKGQLLSEEGTITVRGTDSSILETNIQPSGAQEITDSKGVCERDYRI